MSKNVAFELPVEVATLKLKITPGLGVEKVLEAGFFEEEGVFCITFVPEIPEGVCCVQGGLTVEEFTVRYTAENVRKMLADAVEKEVTAPELEISFVIRLRPLY